MNLKKSFFIMMVMVLIACLAVNSAFAGDVSQTSLSDEVSADAITIDNSSDIISHVGSSNSFSQLQTLIDGAGDGSTLDLDSDYSYNKDTDDVEGISITKDITINGNGFTLDGKNLARIFIMENSAVTINNLKFVNANIDYDYDYGSGGAIYSDGVDLTLNGCTFENNTGYYGAAIDCEEGSICISNCDFINNWANYYGGAIYAYDNPKLIINNCSFVDNTADEDGGAIDCEEGSICISNCDFINNWANYYGGAIYAYDNPKLIINNCSFVDNTADDEDGGAIECEYTNLELIDSTFINNVAGDVGGAIDCYTDSAYYEYTVSIIKCNFSNNVAGDVGGAIYFEEMETNISDSSFINNSADNGGALYFNGFPSYDSPAYIMNSIFSSNYAEENGGAIDFNGQDTFSYVINSTFVYNEADNGGAIFGSQENGVVTENSTYVLNSANTNGGAIYFDCDYEENYVNSCTFLGNSAEYGGAIYNKGYVHDIIHSIFDGNNATCAKDLYNDVFIMYFLGKYNENYWSMNFTSVDEFVKAGLVYQTSYEDTFNKIKYVVDDYVAPDNWVLMHIYGPEVLKVGYNESFDVKFDKLTDGKDMVDFTAVLPPYYTNVYAYDSAAEDSYNYKWDSENVDVAEFVDGIWIKNNEGTFNYVASDSDVYKFRTHSPFTNWEEAVCETRVVLPAADVGVTKVADKAKYFVGDEVVYTITVINNGPDIAFKTIVKDVLPEGLKFKYAIASIGSYDQETGIWSVGDLENGESATLTIHVIAEKIGNVVNEASVNSSSFDYNPDNNVDNVSIKVVKKVDPNPNPNPNPNPEPSPAKDIVNILPKAGNPLALVVLSILTLVFGGLKRKL